MGHSTAGPGQVGPEKAHSWPLAEGEAILGVSPQPVPSAPLFISSPSGSSPGALPLGLGGALWGLLEVASEGCGFLPAQVGQVGLRPVGKLKVWLPLPHLKVASLVPLRQRCLVSVALVPPRGTRDPWGRFLSLLHDIYILGTFILGFLFLSF